MISTSFILLGAVILNIITVLLTGFSYIVPDAIQTALNWLFSSVHILDGIFPVTDLLSASLVLISVWGFMYLIKIFLWLISFIPGVGHHQLPSVAGDLTDSSYSPAQRATIEHSRFKRMMERSDKIFHR